MSFLVKHKISETDLLNDKLAPQEEVSNGLDKSSYQVEYWLESIDPEDDDDSSDVTYSVEQNELVEDYEKGNLEFLNE